jgi:hypothetical protein
VKADNGYISDYLVHWTGKNGDDRGAEVLSLIASTCRLLLSYNVFHILDIYRKIHEKMVCFTDVPLSHARQHCKSYGRFGIAFHKLRLMNVGAQPVFYTTHANKHDLDIIFDFLQEQSLTTSIETSVFAALQRHFYFMQTFSEGRADKKDTYYYQREWRLGKQNLAPVEMWNRPDNPKYHIIQAGYPRYCGKLFVDGEQEYFQFCKSDVAFLISPQPWKARIQNPHEFQIEDYEQLVNDL